MFPGMFGGAPEPLAEHKAERLFWARFNRFLTFVVVVSAAGYVIRHVERKAGDLLLDGVFER
jgi:hypothetical protein